MLLFTVGSGDANRNENQRAVTGPKQRLCNCNRVLSAANRHFIWSVTFDACLLLGNPLSHILVLLWWVLSSLFFEGYLETLSSLDPVNSRPSAIKHHHSFRSKRHFQVQWGFKQLLCTWLPRSHAALVKLSENILEPCSAQTHLTLHMYLSNVILLDV